MIRLLLRITAPHFVAGIDTWSRWESTPFGDVIHHTCAPIIKYMDQWSIKRIDDYCQKKRWKLEVMS